MDNDGRIIDIVAEVLEQSADHISADDRFIDDLGATSIDIVTLAWRIEEVFGIGEIDEETLNSLETVADLGDLVQRRTIELEETVDIVFASDHAGVNMKADLVDWVDDGARKVRDLGPADTNSVDYPDFAARVARQVAAGRADRGILICGSGIGMSIAANKVDGVRAAVVNNPVQARLARRHNNANVLCLGERLTGQDMARECVDAFLNTSFDPGDDGRHHRRVCRIHELEKPSSSD